MKTYRLGLIFINFIKNNYYIKWVTIWNLWLFTLVNTNQLVSAVLQHRSIPSDLRGLLCLSVCLFVYFHSQFNQTALYQPFVQIRTCFNCSTPSKIKWGSVFFNFFIPALLWPQTALRRCANISGIIIHIRTVLNNAKYLLTWSNFVGFGNSRYEKNPEIICTLSI